MGVGKSSLISQYIKKEFPESPLPTIAIEFTTKILRMRNGDKIKMQIWDTAGQEKYKSITSHHYKKAVGALLVYDVTRRITFEDCKKWYSELKNYTDKECIICIVGNKIDIVQKNQKLREVTREEGENFSKKNNTLFYEMSARKYDEINKCFEDLIRKIYETKKENLKMSGKYSMNESFIVKEGMIKNNGDNNYCC
jgi:Rab family protein